jgi:hypothetical protein
MTDEQLMYLRTLKPAATELPWMCDRSQTVWITIVDAASSWKQFKTDNSTASCGKKEVTLTIPATIEEHFSEGGLPCIDCANSPCVTGVCVDSLCVNGTP